jgi:polysaccharide export outer membrane protein
MTEDGDRTTVTIVRENNGQAEYHVINLNNSDVVSSPYYYLQQNDVVLVAPTESRESNARYDSNNSYRVQVVSTIVSAISVIASLVIALSVK